MAPAIERIGPADLHRYASVSSAFRVESLLEVQAVDRGLGGFELHDVPVQPSYQKDYDAGGGPRTWHGRFDLDTWGLYLACDGGEAIGGAAVAPATPGIAPLAWPDAATLYDIRVRSDRRGEGHGGRLLDAAVAWAREQGKRSLLIETQNVNVPACRFYAGHGCELAAVDRYAYAAQLEVAHEVMLVWRLNLFAAAPPG